MSCNPPTHFQTITWALLKSSYQINCGIILYTKRTTEMFGQNPMEVITIESLWIVHSLTFNIPIVTVQIKTYNTSFNRQFSQ